MTDDVKPPAGRRAQKALETRRRVLDAARALFVAEGYAATTINAIAEAADVAVQTVYAVFGNKRAILTELLAVATVGDDDGTALRDRDEWRAMEDEPDARRLLELLAAIATRIGGRIAPLYEVMSAAAGSDPDIAEMFRRQQQARYDDQRRAAAILSRRGALRSGLTEKRATDIMWTLASPRTLHSLVTERRWSTKEYQRWLADLLAATLLGEG